MMRGGRGGFRGNRHSRAQIPFNKEGRIAPYSRDGGRGRRRPGGDSDQNRFKSRYCQIWIIDTRVGKNPGNFFLHFY